MNTEFGLTNGPFNTEFAPLAALGLCFRQDGTLESFAQVTFETQKTDFSPAIKLIQVLSSLLADCEYLCEVNTRLRSETLLAHAWGFERYLEQSSLASGLNQLSRKQLEQLELVSRSIWRLHSRSLDHDWREFLRLELDLSGLPCGKRAEESEKGYFSEKKTPLDANWPVSVPPSMVKRCGLRSILVLDPVSLSWKLLSWQLKTHSTWLQKGSQPKLLST
jgi:hypothetical protein